MLKEHNILNLFDVIIFSAEFKVIKPDPKIFQIALDKLKNIKPYEAIFIGDSYIFDILGANHQTSVLG
jgi:putative hydrolase of the HAD superfamily